MGVLGGPPREQGRNRSGRREESPISPTCRQRQLQEALTWRGQKDVSLSLKSWAAGGDGASRSRHFCPGGCQSLRSREGILT